MDAATRARLIEEYARGADDVRAALASAPDDAALDARPAPAEWSARQVVHHLADSETMSTIRLRRVLAEDGPLLQAYDENQFAARLHYERPLELSLAVFAAVRAANVELLACLTEAEWTRQGTHSDDGPYRVEHWLATYAAHGRDHADQIREAIRSA